MIAGLGVFVAELLRVTGLPDLSDIALPGLSSILPSLLSSIVAVVAAVPIILGIVSHNRRCLCLGEEKVGPGASWLYLLINLFMAIWHTSYHICGNGEG